MAKVNVSQDTVKEWDPSISCISTTRTKRGRHLAINYFDVPEEDYGVGFLRGADIAVELFKELKNTPYRRFNFVLQEAARHIESQPGMPNSKRGAACGLHYTFFDCVEFASAKLDLVRVAAIVANHCKESHARVSAREAADKVIVSARMAKVREAKRVNSAAEVPNV